MIGVLCTPPMRTIVRSSSNICLFEVPPRLPGWSSSGPVVIIRSASRSCWRFELHSGRPSSFVRSMFASRDSDDHRCSVVRVSVSRRGGGSIRPVHSPPELFDSVGRSCCSFLHHPSCMGPSTGGPSCNRVVRAVIVGQVHVRVGSPA